MNTSRPTTAILVVDDDELLRSVVAIRLQSSGFKTVLAQNGQAALDALDQQKDIKAVISDVRMPQMDGVQLLAEIKKRNCQSPAVILMSGYNGLSAESVYDLGAEAMLEKPFEFSQIIQALETALLPSEQRWSTDSTDDERRELDSFSIAQALRDGSLHFGRGGFFLPSIGQPLTAGSRITFNVPQAEGHCCLRGAGVIRWVRPKAAEGLPAGFGIEFSYLDAQTKADILTLLRKSNPKAFIPQA